MAFTSGPKRVGTCTCMLKSQKTVAPLTFGDLCGSDLVCCTQYLVALFFPSSLHQPFGQPDCFDHRVSCWFEFEIFDEEYLYRRSSAQVGSHSLSDLPFPAQAILPEGVR